MADEVPLLVFALLCTVMVWDYARSRSITNDFLFFLTSTQHSAVKTWIIYLPKYYVENKNFTAISRWNPGTQNVNRRFQFQLVLLYSLSHSYGLIRKICVTKSFSSLTPNFLQSKNIVSLNNLQMVDKT